MTLHGLTQSTLFPRCGAFRYKDVNPVIITIVLYVIWYTLHTQPKPLDKPNQLIVSLNQLQSPAHATMLPEGYPHRHNLKPKASDQATVFDGLGVGTCPQCTLNQKLRLHRESGTFWWASAVGSRKLNWPKSPGDMLKGEKNERQITKIRATLAFWGFQSYSCDQMFPKDDTKHLPVIIFFFCHTEKNKFPSQFGGQSPPSQKLLGQ